MKSMTESAPFCNQAQGPTRPPPVSHQFSRVVEYSIDATNQQAAFVRDYSFRGGYDTWSSSAGLVAPQANGNWLVSWGSMRTIDDNLATPPPPGHTLTEIDPDTNEEVFSLRMTSQGELLTTRAHRVPIDAVRHHTVDVTAPVVSTATVDNGVLEITFDEDLDETSTPDQSDFTITVNGTTAPLAGMPTVVGRTVRLALATPASSGDNVEAAYPGTALRDTAPQPNQVASFGPIAATGAFIDIADHDLAQEIMWLTTRGITLGCTPNRYCPDQPVTRAQMASLLARALHRNRPLHRRQRLGAPRQHQPPRPNQHHPRLHRRSLLPRPTRHPRPNGRLPLPGQRPHRRDPTLRPHRAEDEALAPIRALHIDDRWWR